MRRKCSGAMFELGDSKLNEDVVVPMRQYVAFARFLDRLRRESGLPIPTFGHLGDGNVHVNIMYHGAARRNAGRRRRPSGASWRRWSPWAAPFPASTGSAWPRRRSCASSTAPPRSGRCAPSSGALDPRGILNPGKMFEMFRVWEHERLAGEAALGPQVTQRSGTGPGRGLTRRFAASDRFSDSLKLTLQRKVGPAARFFFPHNL